MTRKLSTIYANRHNKRMGRKLGFVAPTLRNYFNSLFIVRYNKLMEEGPKGFITMFSNNDQITDSLGNLLCLYDNSIANTPYIKEVPLFTIVDSNYDYLMTTTGEYIRTFTNTI